VGLFGSLAVENESRPKGIRGGRGIIDAEGGTPWTTMDGRRSVSTHEKYVVYRTRKKLYIRLAEKWEKKKLLKRRRESKSVFWGACLWKGRALRPSFVQDARGI